MFLESASDLGWHDMAHGVRLLEVKEAPGAASIAQLVILQYDVPHPASHVAFASHANA